MIKVGDLVVVVGPRKCCGSFSKKTVGRVTGPQTMPYKHCVACGYRGPADETAWLLDDGFAIEQSRLKKIDPPAEGETREAYKNLEVPA